jgi:hypothetical protein
MNAKVLALACAAALAAAGLVEGVAAQGLLVSHPLSAEQAFDVDAQDTASYLGIPIEAARSRLNVDEHLAPITGAIREQFANRLAGIYIEHEPTHRLVVRLTGNDLVLPENFKFGDDELEVDFEPGAPATFAELQQRFDKAFPALLKRMPALRSGYVDERTSNIVLEVLRDPKSPILARTAAAQQRLADSIFGMSTQLVGVTEPIFNQTVHGSGTLDFYQGMLATTCTGAFTVRTTGSIPVHYGLLTAGHCQSDNGIYNYTEAQGTTTATLTHVARKFDADTDIGWAETGTVSTAVDDQFMSDHWRTVSGTLSKASTTVNQTMCGYGAASGHRCGTVQSTAYNPGSICNGTCNSVYVRVDAAINSCVASDSGGPWHDGDLAAGVHKAGTALGSLCVYTSVDDIVGSPLFLQIL